MAIEKNNVVSMFYELKDANTNEVLESNLYAQPISFILGKGQILDSLEEEIAKLDCPSNTEILIKKDKALGEYDANAIQTLPKEQFAGIDLKIGMELFGEGENGENVRVSVKDIKEDSVTIDYNHPYAGRDLLFSLNLVDVRPASEDEILTGIIAGSHSCGCGNNHEHKHHHEHKGGGCCGGHGGCGCH
ncbi:peptidylprolyl isomerase [Campylobacter novaezeelandiae]|uniref:FKBP-type peptidyl-prolyl cis-trans isomerase n=1 Tax=Campylobacter novaezeelandiae TaxID=2267891 RepID=UPI001037A75F|nr:peptidylprolyl isomerase [Campylobacter novaezeelandiae]MBK1963824.1 peptidylprolyl isomerase [Campylobacter novaezeelandiae]MBK1992753.1 peptidylprolyl isomerase [Campylobacter novaezeelandiae]QWU79458.1 FKBP-type peptidyl-prolyl cis-trans isomerase [Campylobacter novaezeelandiae]TBR78157.1 peptidylprolyl isomerase [Campylobacter novaezeelandiae]TBR80242.1 peptidylprolyl isomerase [Campylobacter novaezeelandiae]